MALPALPVDDVLPQILAALKSSGAVVLKAPPGAGKTTRVPPAILDALPSLAAGQGGAQEVVLLQPRRVAARAAAARIADERGTRLGDEIGYRVRFESKTSARTRLLVCTEGVFLRRLQDDPFLERVAAVVFDEFHERSLDADLALAMARRVRDEVRPDLKIIVMSATLDPTPIAKYLGGCPTVESLGRTFPVAIEQASFSPTGRIEQQAAEAVRRLLSRTDGDLLVFLPGVGEIRRTQDELSDEAARNDLALMPLYGDLPLEEQRRVLEPCPRRKVVLATNVAETSLTIDGVTGVVDTGWARVMQFDARLGLNRLELARISRASAEQRAGRAGRTKPGLCVRLWTDREQSTLRDFEMPEIARVELSEAALQLLAWGESDVRAFPWYEPPPAAALDAALELLQELGATDERGLTDDGRRMARLPLQPRLARLLVEGDRLGHADRAALTAALLADRDPFAARGPRSKAEHHTDSDVLDRLAWLERSPRDARQVFRAQEQLLSLLGEPNQRIKQSVDGDEAVMRALTVAFPDRLCRRRIPGERRAIMVGGRGVRLADESAVATAELFIAVELNETGKAETLVRQASAVERSWLPADQISTTIETAFDAQRQRVTAVRRTRFVDLVLDETPAALPPDVDPGPMLAAAVAELLDPATLVDDAARRYLARVQCLREWLPTLELPDFGPTPWHDLLPTWCIGKASVAELRDSPPINAIQARLTPQQIAAVEREAPERIEVPSGSRITLEYEVGKPPILAVRIQELFGLAATPRVAGGRVPVLLHLLAPNYRVQQITPDLASFWKNTYGEVKKELKRRYPKHSWPDDPLRAAPEHRPQRRRP